LKIDKSPFASSFKTNEAVQWVEPKLVCEVKFSEWTGDGHMRQPIYLAMRDDKDPKDCHIEKKAHTKQIVEKTSNPEKAPTTSTRPKAYKTALDSILLTDNLKGNLTVKAAGGEVNLTHLDKVLWPRDRYAKRDLLKYYYQIAPYLMPYVKERPLILKRYPNGIDEQPFHQHTIQNPPDFVDTYVRDKEDDDDSVVYAICNNVASMLYVANLGSISFHPWSARRQTPQKPDWILFDLDPGQASFDQVLEVALILRDQLKRIGLESHPKTSGSKGIHVYVPVRNVYTHDQIVQFATVVAHLTAAGHPDLIEVERMTSKRKKGRVYLDYLQNGFGKSLAAPYSVRARDLATVSAPVTWDEVKKGKLKIQDFTIKTMLSRIEKVGDLFKGAISQKQSLSSALDKIAKEWTAQNSDSV
jgi:bifunctional non-homologous end joining protein LigD